MPAIGVLTAVAGIFLTEPRESDRNGLQTINRGFFASAGISAALVVVAAFIFLPGSISELEGVSASVLASAGDKDPRIIAIVSGAHRSRPRGGDPGAHRLLHRDQPPAGQGHRAVLADRSRDRHPGGFSIGLESAVYSALLIGAAVYGAALLGGGSIVLSLFAVALAGTGLLTTVGVIVSMDTFGPVSDNAQGIAEMSHDIDEKGAQVLTDLDAVGNTTKAITKGIAIATAVLAATALFGSFTDAVVTAVGSRVRVRGRD